jgi:micrococcal nuclease
MLRKPRRYWRQPRPLAFFLLCCMLVLWRIYAAPGEAVPPPEALDEGLHHVRRVIDGDTLLLESGARVRLQGIDTPETVKEDAPVEAWGPEASQFAKDFIDRADQCVRLTFSLERKDRHDRFLAFVWNGEVMLNEELVRAGLAHARLDYRYSSAIKRRLSIAQEEARKAGRGLWSQPAVAQAGRL